VNACGLLFSNFKEYFVKEFDGSEPAFPFRGIYATDEQHEGISIRDHFAVNALPSVYSYYVTNGRVYPGWHDGVAVDAYIMADAMLKARKININSK
jgi:hypothetical protein